MRFSVTTNRSVLRHLHLTLMHALQFACKPVVGEFCNSFPTQLGLRICGFALCPKRRRRRVFSVVNCLDRRVLGHLHFMAQLAGRHHLFLFAWPTWRRIISVHAHQANDKRAWQLFRTRSRTPSLSFSITGFKAERDVNENVAKDLRFSLLISDLWTFYAFKISKLCGEKSTLTGKWDLCTWKHIQRDWESANRKISLA